MSSLRVAVVRAGEEGALQVVPLAPGQASPQGAAVAVLVPISDSDSQTLGRLVAESVKVERA